MLFRSFEDWPLQRAAFALVISAQAFHWIPPEIGYAKAAASLRDSGSIALFWNHNPYQSTVFSQALDEVYRSNAPELANPPRPESLEILIKDKVEAIRSSGFFGDVVVKRYPWSEQYTTERYIKLLNTHSDHLNLAEETRRGLFANVRELIEQFDGVVTRSYLAVLYWAEVRMNREDIYV